MNPYRSISDSILFLAKIALAAVAVILLGREAGVSDMLTLVFVTLLCLSPTTLGGLRIGLQQFLIAIFASLLAQGVTLLLGNGPAGVALALILVTLPVIHLKFDALLPIAYFSTLYIAYFAPTHSTSVFIERIEHLVIGIPLAAVLNTIFGLLGYRRRLRTGLKALRRDLLGKTADILEAVLTAGLAGIERELRGAEEQYVRAAALLHMLEDIERERAMPFGGRLPEVREYKNYIWNLRDLMQHAHSCAVLRFKMPVEDDALRRHLVALLGVIRRGINESLPAPEPLPELPAPAGAAGRTHLVFLGNLLTMAVHLRSLIELEKTLPELRA